MGVKVKTTKSIKFLIFSTILLLMISFVGSIFFFTQNKKNEPLIGSIEVSRLSEKYSAGRKVTKIIEKDLLTEEANKKINIYDFCKSTNTEISEDDYFINLKYGDYNVNIDKQNNYLVDTNGNVVYFGESNGNNIYPLTDIAKSLGFTLNTEKENIKLTRPYQTKRVIVKVIGEFDTIDAIEKVHAFDNTYVLQYKTEIEAQNAIKKLKLQKNVKYAEPNIIVSLDDDLPVDTTSVQATSNTFLSWGGEALGVDDYKAYLENAIGENNLDTLTIAVLDTGIDTTHEMFADRISQYSHNFVNTATPNNPQDVHGHGTHVAGIICDLTYSNVKILALKVLNDNGEGELGFILNALEYVKNQKLSTTPNLVAINMSLGGNNEVDETEGSAYDLYRDAIVENYNVGVLSIVAAGNGDPDNNNMAIDVKYACPANVSKAITVGAVGLASSGEYYIGYFSNYGQYVDISAPGIDINSACVGGGTTIKSGTSMATPHVSAVLALLLSDKTTTYSTLAEIEEALKFYTVDVGDNGWDEYYGVGVPDLTYAYCEMLEPVSFSRTETKCTEPFELTLSHENTESNVKILYTLDGNTPTASNATVYSAPITISSSTTVKAIACVLYEGAITKCSKVSQITYQFDFVVDEDGLLIEYNGNDSEIIVPSSVGGITVIGIDTLAFQLNTTITSVELPSSVKYINFAAFRYCINLKKIKAPGVVYIDERAFENCTSLNYLTDAYFPNLKAIYQLAFYGCTSITSINLSNVSYIAENAFEDCTKLGSITLNNVTNIGGEAFFNCYSLASINLPKCQVISNAAFKNCSLLEISCPDLLLIGSSAFVGNLNLVAINLPSAIYIGNSAFENTAIDTVNAPSVQIIGRYAFFGCSDLKTIDVSSAIRIEEAAFGDTALTSIKLDSARHIGSMVFQNTSLTEISFPSLIRLDGYCLQDLTTLRKVTFSSCVELIEPRAINNCTNATIYGYPGTVAESYATEWGYNFSPLDSNETGFTYVKVDNKEIHISGYTTNLKTNAIIPDYIENLPVTTILENAFLDCIKLTKIQSSTIKEIKSSAFKNCTALTTIILPKTTIIGNEAFKGCTNLSSISLENIISIGDSCFENCISLLSFSFNKNTTTIGNMAVGYIDGVINDDIILYCYEGTAGETYITDNNFTNVYYTAVELGSFYYNYYTTESGDEDIYIYSVGKDVYGEIILPSEYNGFTISKVGANAFENCSFITAVTLPSSYTIIEDSAFKSCSLLRNINLENITYIGESAFAYCYNLQTANLLSAEYIGASCFCFNSALEVASIPNIEDIPATSFYACYNLHTVIGDRIKTIGSQAFWGNYKLTNINLKNVKKIETGFTFANKEIYLPSIEILGSNSLATNNQLEKIVINKTIQTIYNNAILRYGSNPTVYGYSGTVIETYCNTKNITFVAIDDLAITENVKSLYEFNNVSTDTNVTLTTTGFDVNYIWYKNTTDSTTGATEIKNSYDNFYKVDNLAVGEFYIYCTATDWLGNTITSNIGFVKVTYDIYYKVTTTVHGEGTITPGGEVFVKQNTNARFMFLPAMGWEVSIVKIDGIAKGKPSSHLFPSISENHTIEVYFTKVQLKITANTDGNGVISPSGETYVEYGTDITFTFSPNEGYLFDYVEVDGTKVDVDSNLSYTFISPTKNYEITAFFKIIVLEVNIIANNADVNPSGKYNVNYGDALTVNIKDTLEFQIVKILMNGETLLSRDPNKLKYNEPWINSFTIGNTGGGIKENFTLEIVTVPHQYLLTISTGLNGTSEYSEIVCEYNQTATINLLPDNGYKVSKVLIDGEEVDAETIIEITDISSNHEISAEFEPVIYKITFELGGFGTIQETTEDTAKYGENKLYTINSNPLYEVSEVYVNGKEVEVIDGNKINLQNITADTKIEVLFRKNIELPIALTIVAVIVMIFGIFLFLAIKRRIRVKNRNKTNLTSMIHSSRTTDIKNIKIREEYLYDDKPRKNKKF